MPQVRPQPAGPVAIVTGAGSAEGIGFATAKALAEAGFRLAITATSARIHDRRTELGAGHLAFAADLTDPAAARAIVEEVQKSLGPVSALINNAGMVQTGRKLRAPRLEALSDADWHGHLEINLTTAFNMTRAVLPAMQAAGFGRIVNVASVTGPVVSFARTAGYSAAKAAMCGLTRAIAIENAGLGITCNAVLPGWIATGSATARERAAGRRSPAGRPGTPAEVAACCLFLASEGASYVNGAMLVVDGANSVMETK